MSHYFDANATTPLLPEARAAWLEAVDECWHNPSSPTRAAARVMALLEAAREDIAGYFGAAHERVIFNSGATEGNRDVLAYLRRIEPAKRMLMSAIEHPSVRENTRAIFGPNAGEVAVDKLGRLDLAALEEALSAGGVSLVSLLAASNETGVIQPWREALAVCRRHGAALHLDATQWVGKEDLAGLAEADFVTVSGHKFGGPKGAGWLIVSPAFTGFSGQRGGAQENDHRAGTENYPAIAAMRAALVASEAHRAANHTQCAAARDNFEAQLTASLPGVSIWGQGAPRLANTSSVCLPIGENMRWVRRLDAQGYLVSTGSACATGKAGPSHVLAAMGATADETRRTVRVSSLPTTSDREWGALASAMISLLPGMGDDGSNSQVISI